MKRIYILVIGMILFALSAGAQDICDSLEIISIKYDPFYDSFLNIHVKNHSSRLVGYPQFVIYNSNADTAAVERINLFGMGQESDHLLAARPGAITTNQFNGYLQLTGTDSVFCFYEKQFSLCPDSVCEYFYAELANFGSSYTYGTLNWTLEDNMQQVIASGQWTMDDSLQVGRDSLCIKPGNYILKTAGTLTGGQPYLSLYSRRRNYHIITTRKYAPGADFDFPFSFYKKCGDPIKVAEIEKHSTEPVTVLSDGQAIYLTSQSGHMIGDVCIYTTDGRIIKKSSYTTVTERLDVSHLPPAIYIVRVTNSQGITVKKVFAGR